MENGWTKRIEELKAENKRLREERDRYLEELVVAKNVIKSDESQIKNLIKRNDEMRDDCIRTAEQRDKLADENAKLRAFWEWSRLADKMTFEQYHWIGKEASHEHTIPLL